MPLMLPSCNCQPNWMPRNPKLMFQICQKLKRGLFMKDSFDRIYMMVQRHCSCINCDRTPRKCCAKVAANYIQGRAFTQTVVQCLPESKMGARQVELDFCRFIVVIEDYDNCVVASHTRVGVLLLGNVEINERASP